MKMQQISGVSGGGMFFSAKTASTKSGDGNFEQLMQISQKTETVQPGAKSSESGTPGAKASEVQKTAETAGAEQPKTTEDASLEQENTSVTEEKPDAAKNCEAKEATDVEAAERVAVILNQVAEAVQEILGLTETELDTFLEEAGLSQADLLQPETLKNLVLAANSEQDAVVLLTDARLLSDVNELTEAVEQILQEAGVTPEQLLEILEQPDFDSVLNEVLEQLPEKQTNDVPEEPVDAETNVLPEETIPAKEDNQVELSTAGKDTESSTNTKEDSPKDFMETDKVMEQFVQNLQQAVGKSAEGTVQDDAVAMIREIADQILEKVKVSVNSETTSLEMVLTPEELGRVNLTVTTEQDGTMKAKFVTENEMAKEAIERNLVQFKETLQEQGIKVDVIEVAVGNFEFDRNGQAGENSEEQKKNGNHRFLSEEELNQKEGNDHLAQVFLEGGESTVNYMA